jgi:xanthine/uracil permease
VLKYSVDDRPPFMELILLGLQWLAIVIPIIVVIGRIVSKVGLAEPIDQVQFMQKTALVIGVTMCLQILVGHRLPLVAGPATVLVVGLAASQGFSQDVVFTAMMLGGALLAVSAAIGLFAHVRRLFTPRVVSVILLLIAFTLAPSILGLVETPGQPPLPRITFAVAMTFAMFLVSRYLKGIWKTTLILWSIFGGTAVCAFLFPGSIELASPPPRGALFLTGLTTHFAFEPGILLSFLVCYLGLSINDLGSIESVGELVRADFLGQRVTRGIALSGIAGVVSGFLGVVGPVNYSLSPGVIMATGCASRFTLLPTALLIFCLAFSAKAFAIIAAVPSLVIGSVFLYLMVYQIAAGLTMLVEEVGGFQIEDGLVVGLPLLLGTVIAFMPPTTAVSLPVLSRPLAGNGFLIGVVSVLVMEHVLFRRRRTGS